MFVSQGLVAFPKGYHQSLVGENIDESWDSFGATKKKIHCFFSKQVRAIVSRFDEAMI